MIEWKSPAQCLAQGSSSVQYCYCCHHHQGFHIFKTIQDNIWGPSLHLFYNIVSQEGQGSRFTFWFRASLATFRVVFAFSFTLELRTRAKEDRNQSKRGEWAEIYLCTCQCQEKRIIHILSVDSRGPRSGVRKPEFIFLHCHFLTGTALNKDHSPHFA